MAEAGAGVGEWVQETAFKYVGKGAGDFNLEDAAAPASISAVADHGLCSACPACGQCQPLNRIADFVKAHFLAVFFSVVAALIMICLAGNYWSGGGGGTHPDGADTTTNAPATPAECFADALQAALSEEEMPRPHQRFEITLDHSDWERFGCVLKSEEHSLLVADIDGGLLGHWNSAHESRQVLKGDHVVKVNDVSSSTQKMLVALNKPTVIHLTILRANCDDVGGSTTTHPLDSPSDWDCHDWTAEEKDMLKSWTADEEQICTRSRHDGYDYRYTRGDESMAPGCHRCWCCRREHGVELAFKQGVAGYQGVRLKQLRADSIVDDNVDVLTVDTSDEGGHRTQVLALFDDIIGRSPSQVRPGSAVLSATLRLNVVNPGGGFEAHRMLVPWDDSTSFEDLGGDGVTLGVEAEKTALDLSHRVNTGVLAISLKDAVQAWADGKPNYGIVLMPVNSDGVGFTTLQSVTPPTLSARVVQAAKDVTTTTQREETPKTTTTRKAPHRDEDTGGHKDVNPVVVHTTAVTTASPTSPTSTTQAQPTGTVNGNGLRAEFFFDVPHDAYDWSTAVKGRQPDLVRTDPDVNCGHASSCWDGVRTNASFAAHWSGTVELREGGLYSFEVRSDDISELALDGEVLLGGEGAGIGLSPLLLLSHRLTTKDLSAGPHSISITLLQLETRAVIGFDCRYQGPDTGGFMVSLPQDALRPAAQSAPPPSSLQRKFNAGPAAAAAGAGIAQAAMDSARSAGVAASVVLLAGLLLSLAPGLKLAVDPWRRAWRVRVQQRSLRRYNDLSTLVEGVSGGTAHGLDVHDGG